MLNFMLLQIRKKNSVNYLKKSSKAYTIVCGFWVCTVRNIGLEKQTRRLTIMLSQLIKMHKFPKNVQTSLMRDAVERTSLSFLL